MDPGLEQSRWFSFARFDAREVAAWEELLLQLGLRVPSDLSEVLKRRGLPTLPRVRTRSGVEVTGSLSFFTTEELFFRARTSSSPHVQLGLLDLVGAGRDDGEEDEPELLLDAAGRYGRQGLWTTTRAAQLAATDRDLRALEGVALEVDLDEEAPRREETLADLEELVARKRRDGRPWWSYDWRRLFYRHPDAALAREILTDIGNGHGQTRGGSLVAVEDLVHRLPETARRAWAVEELSAAGPPTPALAVSLDVLSEALDGRVVPREHLERLVPLAWTDRAPAVDTPSRWARALLFALGRPVTEHLLHAVRLVHGPRESLAQWDRALAFARAAGVI